MGSIYECDCPFDADNGRKRREEIEAAQREALDGAEVLDG